MNSLKFTRGQGGIPAILPGEDHISGFCFVTGEPTYTEHITGTNPVVLVSSLDIAESLGIKPDAEAVPIRVLHYHISEIFRVNPSASLHIGVCTMNQMPNFIEEIQNNASGKIRQFGVYVDTTNEYTTYISELQGVANKLRSSAVPAHIITNLPAMEIENIPNLTAPGLFDISVVCGESQSIKVRELKTAGVVSVTDVGTVLGLISKAKVNESIGWVQKFNSGITDPGLIDGSEIKQIDTAVLEQLDADGYIFFRTYPGIGGSYANDSRTLDIQTSDYNTIERNRTMDKAERGIRTYLTPYIAAPLYVDAESGKLSVDTVAFLETLAGKQLEDMEKAGELSGYKVTIDPEQNVLASSTVEFVIKQVPVGVMRRVNVKIGYTTKIT